MRKMRDEADIALKKVIARNLKRIMEERGRNITEICDTLQKKGKVSVERTTLSKFLNCPEKNSISLAFLVECAGELNTTIDKLVIKENVETLFEMNRSLNESTNEEQYFITKPSSRHWKQYLQVFHCYYFSTVADENRKENPIMSGTLEFKDEGEFCGVTMKIDTKKHDLQGNPIYKKYIGYAVICPETATVQCHMRENNIGDYCSIAFRHAKINYSMQACKIAEVLSTSSKPERRYPVVHKMILSKDEIAENDWELLKPHLFLNYSKIIVGEKDMQELGAMCEAYQKIVQELNKMNFEPVHVIKERKIRDIAEKYLDKEQITEFVMRLRSRSLAYRYNKVSPRADSNLWEALSEAGYYKDTGD